MHQRAIAGPGFDRLQPLRLGESGRDVEVLGTGSCPAPGPRSPRAARTPDRACRCPAVGEIRARRQIRGVALRRAARDPAGDEVFLRGRQPPLVDERAVRRVGVPRRHAALGDAPADGLRPRPRLGVGQERHRREFAGPVAARAVGVENRRDVLRERRDVARLWGLRMADDDRRSAECGRAGEKRESSRQTHERQSTPNGARRSGVWVR